MMSGELLRLKIYIVDFELTQKEANSEVTSVYIKGAVATRGIVTDPVELNISFSTLEECEPLHRAFLERSKLNLTLEVEP